MTAASPHEKPTDTSESVKNYFFGAQGKALVSQISIAGGLGFFLFGYDQGVLGVSRAAFPPK